MSMVISSDLMQGDSLVLGSLEPSYAVLHVYFGTGQNLRLPVAVHEALWNVYCGLAFIRESMLEYCEYWKNTQCQVADVQSAVWQARQHGFLPTSVVAATLANALPLPPDLGRLYPVVDSLNLLVNSPIWNVGLFQNVVPLDLCLRMQHLPRDVVLFRQQLHRQSEDSKNLLVRVSSMQQQPSSIMVQQQVSNRTMQEKAVQKSADAVRDTTRAEKIASKKRQKPPPPPQHRDADLFVKELSRHGKLIKSTGFISVTAGTRIQGRLNSVKLPSRLDLSGIRPVSDDVFRELALALVSKESVKDLTLPALPPNNLRAFADCFRTAQLERLEVKMAVETVSREIFHGLGVRNAFTSLGRLATESFSLFVYSERYDYGDVLSGIAAGFSQLAKQPSFQLALSLKGDPKSVAVGDALLRTDIATDIFLVTTELNDSVYAAISRLLQSRSLRKLYICDAVLRRVRNEALLQSLVDSFDRTLLEILVLGGLKCYEDTDGFEFVDAVSRSLASSGCPIRHLWLSFSKDCRAWGIQRQRKLIKHLPAMKALRSLSCDCYPETSSEVRKAAKNIDLRWIRIPRG